MRLAAFAAVALLAGCGDNIHLDGGQLLVSPTTGLHTSQAGGIATFTVALTDAPSGDVTIELDSTNELEGTVAPASLVFARDDFDQPQTVTITGVDDQLAEGPQAYQIRVVPDSGRIAEVDVDVTNDSTRVAGVAITPTTGLVTTAAGGQATFAVVLTSKPSADVTFALASSNVGDGDVDQSSLTFTTDTWSTPQTVTVTGADGDPLDGNQPYTILTAPTASLDPTYNALDPDDVLVTNVGRALASIEVTPADPSIASGTSQQFVATGVFDDTSTRDLTAQVTWGSSDTGVATMSTGGLASSHTTGSTMVSASLGTITGSTTLDVTSAVLVSIQVTPTDPSIAKGTTQQFVATGVYSDTSTQDLSSQVTWSSSTQATATISGTGLAQAVQVGTTTIGAALGSISGTTTLTVTAATLVSIEVTPSNPTIARFTTQQFVATGVYSDTSTQDLSTQVTWSSSDPSIATITVAGLATAHLPGSTTIGAALGGVSGSTLLTVTDVALVSIAVTPVNPTIATGTKQQFTAIGTYANNATQDLTTQATWGSSNISAATISNAAGSQGLATSHAPGTTTISATFSGITGSTTLTVSGAVLVSIKVTPANPTIAKGTQLQFTATGVYSDLSTQDLTTQVTWASSKPAIATISNASGTQGLASGLAVGASVISAKFGAITGATTLRVSAATLVSIQITPANPTIGVGATQQFVATGTYTDNSTQDLTTQATWGSSNGAVATVSNAAGSQGLATATGVGSTTIGATFSGVIGATTLTVQ